MHPYAAVRRCLHGHTPHGGALPASTCAALVSSHDTAAAELHVDERQSVPREPTPRLQNITGVRLRPQLTPHRLRPWLRSPAEALGSTGSATPTPLRAGAVTAAPPPMLPRQSAHTILNVLRWRTSRRH